MKRHLIHMLVPVGLLLLAACDSSDRLEPAPVNPPVPVTDYTFVNFNVSAGDPGQIPLPNDILRDPATGQLAVPQTGDPAVDALIAQVNTLRGFSTSGQIRIPLIGEVNAETVNAGTIILVDLTDFAAAAQGVPVNPLRQVDVSVAPDENGNHVIAAFPTLPLKPNRTHLVVVTNGIIGTASGLPLESDAVTTLLKAGIPLTDPDTAALEPLRQLYESTLWPVAEAVTGQSKLDIPLTFAFTTQPLFETLPVLRARAKQESPTPDVVAAFTTPDAIDTLYNLSGLGAAPRANVGSIYVGSYNAPWYITDPLVGSFTGEGEAVQEVSRVDIPFLASTPPGPGPFPTIIYQHGITSQKETMLILADAAASVGFAMIAIDLVQHGERTQDLNGDGVLESGEEYINLISPITSRDNNRQTHADQFMLTHMITRGAGDLNGDGVPELLPLGVTYLGISLGGIVGAPFSAVEADIQATNLNVPGGRILYLLQNSPVFGPTIDQGLASFGLVKGTALYDIFFLFAQAITDDADGINYAPHYADGSLAGGVPTQALVQWMTEDIVVPNSATADLARAMNLTQLNAIEVVDGLTQETIPPTGWLGSGLTQFVGGHGALFLPTDGPTVAIGTQSLTFLGTSLLGTPTIIDPAFLGLKTGKMPEINIRFDLMDMDVNPETALRLPGDK